MQKKINKKILNVPKSAICKVRPRTDLREHVTPLGNDRRLPQTYDVRISRLPSMTSDLPQQCGLFKINKQLSTGQIAVKTVCSCTFRMDEEIDPLALEIPQALTADEQNAQSKATVTWEHQDLAQVSN